MVTDSDQSHVLFTRRKADLQYMSLSNSDAAAAHLGGELARVRQLRRVTRSRLAMDAGISRVTLANLEAGGGSVCALVSVLAALECRFVDQPAELALGRWIAQSRKRLGLSQDRLCARAHMSKPALVRVERCEGNVSTLISAMTGLDLSVLLVEAETEVVPDPPPTPTARLFHGDCRDHMRSFADQGLLFDAIVTDPPYHLTKSRRAATGFVGARWDGGSVAFDVETWRAANDVLKPGAYLVAFGSPRTFHRLTVAIEDAGFEIRDTIMWIYGSGFPKSLNLRGRHEGRGTALKPAFEPIVIARKPIAEATIAANVVVHGTGAMNIEACSIPPQGSESRRYIKQWDRTRTVPAPSVALTSPVRPVDLRNFARSARWPANVVLTDVEETWGRYFYVTKASKDDRGPANPHPTVKPVDLVRYLTRLVTPPGGTVFDPFAGSGSTGVAAIQEGFGFAGAEMMSDYIEVARRRIQAVMPAGSRVEVDLDEGKSLSKAAV